ncbi:MAG: T9SS type A sorting domain-containing protein [Bacteroidia bacterium]
MALFTCLSFNAQTVTPIVYSNQGAYNTSSGGSISWTIGEPISETYTTSTNMATMGFHQPEMHVSTYIKSYGEQVEIAVYPNPIQDKLIINFSNTKAGIYFIELYDDLGKILQKNEVEIKTDSNKYSLNLSSYSAGNYYLNISGTENTKTVKVIKIP